MDTEGLVLPARDSWKDRIRRLIWPRSHCDLPDAPPTHKDVLVCRTFVEMAFIARLRVLLSGRILVETKTVTENVIGNNVTASVAYPLPPKFLDHPA